MADLEKVTAAVNQLDLLDLDELVERSDERCWLRLEGREIVDAIVHQRRLTVPRHVEEECEIEVGRYFCQVREAVLEASEDDR